MTAFGLSHQPEVIQPGRGVKDNKTVDLQAWGPLSISRHTRIYTGCCKTLKILQRPQA